MSQAYSIPELIPLVVIGAYRPNTGFTRVLESILMNLGPDYDIHYLGLGYRGKVHRIGPITLYPCNLQGGDLFGAYQGQELTEKLKAPLVFLLNDLWILKNYMEPLKSTPDQIKMIAYCPLDGRLPDDSLIAPLAQLDRFVVYTSFAKSEIDQSIQRLRQQGVHFSGSAIDVIPHGVDCQTFYPLAGSIEQQLQPTGRLEAKKRLWQSHGLDCSDLDCSDLENSFVVLNANRPVPRKRIDLTIQGFALFAQQKPDNVKLCLHHAVINDQERQAILTVAQACGIADRLLLSPPIEQNLDPGVTQNLDQNVGSNKPISDQALNWIYNACDVGLNTTVGEGWGLVSFEHGATGAAQIVPRSSACTELWQGRAELLEPILRDVPPYTRLEMAEVSIEGVAQALERLYHDPNHRQALSRLAYHNARQAQYQWPTIAKQWDQLFRSML